MDSGGGHQFLGLEACDDQTAVVVDATHIDLGGMGFRNGVHGVFAGWSGLRIFGKSICAYAHNHCPQREADFERLGETDVTCAFGKAYNVCKRGRWFVEEGFGGL